MSLPAGKFPYVVILKNQSTRAFSVLGILLNIICLLFFLREFVFTSLNEVRIEVEINFFIIPIAVIIGILIYNIIRERKGHKVHYNKAYLVTALLWLKMPFMQWMIVPFVILAILERQIKFPIEIGFSENLVVFNTLFKKKYQWSDLSNVMLKDGLLTMDFMDNRILQREIEEDDEEDDASEEEFNQFCREQLKKNSV